MGCKLVFLILVVAIVATNPAPQSSTAENISQSAQQTLDPLNPLPNNPPVDAIPHNPDDAMPAHMPPQPMIKTPLTTVVASSFMSSITEPFWSSLFEFVAKEAGVTNFSFIPYSSLSHPNAINLLESESLQLVTSCSLPWVRTWPNTVFAVAAPVLRGQEEPVTFSDIVVLNNSPFINLLDTRGKRVAYNEDVSFSGYVSLALALDQTELSASPDFFSDWVETGSHLKSMEAICSGKADVAAIDRVVLEFARLQAQDPTACVHKLRVITSIGPFGMSPLLMSSAFAHASNNILFMETLLRVHEHPEGKQLLEASPFFSFLPVASQNYQTVADAWAMSKTFFSRTDSAPLLHAEL